MAILASGTTAGGIFYAWLEAQSQDTTFTADQPYLHSRPCHVVRLMAAGAYCECFVIFILYSTFRTFRA